MADNTVNIQKGDIVMTFNPDNSVKGIGIANVDASVELEKKIEVDIKDKAGQDKAKLLLNSSSKDKYNDGQVVIVKLNVNSKTDYLYIPGTILKEEEVSGNKVYDVLIAPDRTITKVPIANIRLNYQLKENEEGIYFSDITIQKEITDKITDFSAITDDFLEKIMGGSGKITVNTVVDTKYTHTGNIKLQNATEIPEATEVGYKNVVPLGFNRMDGDNVVLTADASPDKIFGGKKTNTKKTRKNTMPLQFAPGAKRAYLKRRKSLRK